MSFTASTIFSFGASQTGLSDLRAQPRTVAGATTGAAITTGFHEIGQGVYSWTGIVPDDAAMVHAYRAGDATILSVRAVSAPSVSSSGNGDGDISVDHNYGGTDALRIKDADGNPVDNATIRAYVAEDYTAGTIDPDPPATITGSDGRWLKPLNLDADVYKVSVYNPATKQTSLFDLTVEGS